MNVFVIIVIILIILLIVNYMFFNNRNEQFNQILEYAQFNDPYEKPLLLENFITKEHCQNIINFAKDKLVDSEVVGGKHKGIRNSQQCWINKNSPLIKPMYDYVSNMFHIPFENAEDLQVVRYQPGQYYNEHHDACCDDNDKCRIFVKHGGQRKLTVLVYLNNEFDNGHTYFKNLDFKYKPTTGSAIAFYPLAKNTSKCHPYALHAGMPVTSGEKWVANLWFRENRFSV